MLGIDVSKNTLACALVDAATRRILWEEILPILRQELQVCSTK